MDSQNLSHGIVSCMSHHSMQNLYKMRLNNLLCDGTIMLENGTKINVHRPILCACSDYFNSAFNSVFSGTPTNITIVGIGDHVMSKIIDYAYLRSCELTDENVFEVLVIADYLALKSLMDYCIQWIIDHLKPENCINIMRFAFARGLTKDLYAKAKLYVLRNFEVVVAKSDELLEISIDEMFHIMNNDLLNIKDEALAWEGILRWIKYDADRRRQYVPILLTAVRLGILDFKVCWYGLLCRSIEFTLPRKIWCNLNRLRTGHGRCNYMMHKWNMVDHPNCECGEPLQTTNHLLVDCPLYSYDGEISDFNPPTLHAMEWLRNIQL